MKSKTVKRLIALITCLSIATLTGCNSFIDEDIASYPLESPLTQQEVVDYYAKALDYDAVVSKNVTVHETTYETKDIEGEKAEKLKALTKQAETILSKKDYDMTVENLKVVSPDTFNYIKGVLDNEVLSNSTILNIKGALGYYFVDVQYNLSAKAPGSFNQLTTLVGLDGAFYNNADGTYSLDTAYVKSLSGTVNKYFYDNNIISCASYDEGSKIFRIQEGVHPEINSYIYNETSNLPDLAGISSSSESAGGDVATEEVLNAPGDENEEDLEVSDIETTEVTEETTEVVDETTTEDVVAEEIPVETPSMEAYQSLEETPTYNSVVDANRKVQFDTSLVNSIAGSSLRQSATVPNLELVYNKPEPQGDISGYGIYTAGASGMRIFGFDRNALAGTCTLRYVFKDDSNGTGDIIGTNIFVVEEIITNGINVASNNVLIPEFLYTEFEKIIERADRVMVNNDISGLMSGHLYEDMGVGILRGFRNQSTGINKYMSTIRQVINRDTSNNAYLLEVETTTIDGARDVDCYGTYKDRRYVVIQQQGNEFKIVDDLRVSRDVVTEPPINPDSVIQKRLVALNLAGEIPEESKQNIKELMSALYTAGTNRILRGPKDLTINGQIVTLEKGMYDCFQNDTSILSSEQLEYMNSKLRNILTKQGIDVNAIHNGTVTEWIGGYENQAEFTTEELVEYVGRGEGYYMQVYYLVSNLNDVWVIDERTIIDEKEVKSTAELDSIKSRLQ